MSICLFFFFFFSSRRRHTRYWRDWSSDVCSSDLRRSVRSSSRHPDQLQARDADVFDAQRGWADGEGLRRRGRRGSRSEERRVGKECRSGGAPYHEKKKRKEERDDSRINIKKDCA